jgi:NO-binding membrane sensor protein with MHYT domain
MGTVTVYNFSYGLLNPVLGYAISCLGSFLGLRCVTRARVHTGRARWGWLALAAVSLGAAAIWAMHFIAMLGFTIPGQQIRYNVPLTILSMLVAIAVVGIGLTIVSNGNGRLLPLLTGGVIVGVGVASMHYMGMAAMSMPDSVHYKASLFLLSIVIAIVAGTAALWAGTQVRGITVTIVAALIMGVAVSGMHYTGMAAMYLHADPASSMANMSGSTASSFIVPLLFGISLLTFALTLVISLSPTEDEIAEDALLEQRMRTGWAGEQHSSSTPSSSAFSAPDRRPAAGNGSGRGSAWQRPSRFGSGPDDQSQRLHGVVAVNRLSDAGGLGRALAFDDGIDDGFRAVGHVVDGGEGSAQPYLRSGRHRRREAEFVDPVVDRHPDAAEFDDLAPHRYDQGQGQVAVSDRAAERSGGGTIGVRVNPLAVTGRVGERVDPVLCHLEPFAVAEVLAGPGPQLVKVVDDDGHVVSPCSLDLSSFPVAFRGRESANTTDRGILYLASLPSRNPRMSSAVTGERRTTTARPTSPHWSSGTPITAHSAIAGCWQSTCSTSAG